MSKGYKIALFLEISRIYGRELTKGITRYSRLFGPWSFYREEEFYVNKRKGGVSFLKQWGVDGIITRDFKGALSLLDLEVPIVSAKNFGYLEESVQIMTDDNAIGKMAFDHFLRKGFKHFAFCGFSNMNWSQNRQQSFVNAAEQAGFNCSIFNSPSSARMLKRNIEYAKIADWLRTLEKPVAVFCCNDDRGYDLIEACELADIKVPYDVAALGADNDIQICDIANPPLSSISLGIEKAGYQAAEALHKMIEGKEVDSDQIIVNPLKVVVRQSTDIMANEDQMITDALQFIHENSKQLIQAIDVAKAIGLSRRHLDEKFQNDLGHTVFTEIRRSRTETICQLLIETDMTIAEIALMLGYNDPDHIARFFKKEKKITPQLFRKTYSLKKTHYKT